MSAEEFHDFNDGDLLPDPPFCAHCGGTCECNDWDNDGWDDEPADNCSMMPDGQCGQAGSEYCDLECPYRDG